MAVRILAVRVLAVSAAAMLLLAVLLPAPADAGDPDFGSFVKHLERQYQVRRTRIPFFWLAKGVVRIASPAGVSRIDLALFEDQDFSGVVSASDLQSRVNGFLGAGWRPFVEVNSARRGERVLLYMRERGKNVEFFVFTVERNEGVAVLARVNPDTLAKVIENPDSFWRTLF